MEPLYNGRMPFEGSVLLEDLNQSLSSRKGASQNFISSMLQSMSSVHAYIVMFVHICRTGQGDIRAISIEQWGSQLGIDIISQLSKIYISLVWESTLLLGLNDSNSQKYELVKIQLERLNSLLKSSSEVENVASPMEVDSDNNDPVCSSCVNRSENEKKSKSPVTCSKNTQQKYIKPLLTVASKLGRSLAELFGLLVKVYFTQTCYQLLSHNYFSIFSFASAHLFAEEAIIPLRQLFNHLRSNLGIFQSISMFCFTMVLRGSSRLLPTFQNTGKHNHVFKHVVYCLGISFFGNLNFILGR